MFTGLWELWPPLSSNLLDQILGFGGIGSRILVLFGHCWLLTSSSGMTNTSANHYRRSRLIGRILHPCELFSQMRQLTKGHAQTLFPITDAKIGKVFHGDMA
jgi:hypothetical protein